MIARADACIGHVLGDHEHGNSLLRQVKLVLIEHDGDVERVDYDGYWRARLESKGFVRVWHSYMWYAAHRGFHTADLTQMCAMVTRGENWQDRPTIGVRLAGLGY